MIEYSIVIPTHNRKEKLARLLESIRTLEYSPSEVIVVDDASTDKSDELIKIRFPEIRYLKMEKEKWPGFTISYGIAKAHNNLVYIIDDDNVVDDRSVAPLLKVFESDKKSEYGVVGPVTCYFKDKNIIMYAGATYSKITSVPRFIFAGLSYDGLKELCIKDEIIFVDGIPNAFLVRRDYAILAGLIPQYVPAQGEDGFMIYSIKRKLNKQIVVSTNARVFHDYEESGRFSDVRLYYTMRTKIFFIKKFFSPFRKIIILFLMPIVLAYWSFKAINSDRGDSGIWLLLLGYMDGIFDVRDRKFID